LKRCGVAFHELAASRDFRASAAAVAVANTKLPKAAVGTASGGESSQSPWRDFICKATLPETSVNSGIVTQRAEDFLQAAFSGSRFQQLSRHEWWQQQQ